MVTKTLATLLGLIPLTLFAQITFERTYGEGGAYAVTQTTDFGYFVVGYSGGIGGSDVYVVAADQYGEESWTQLFGGTDDDCGYGVATFTDGGVLAAGWLVTGGNAEVALHSNMANGDQRWIRVYGGSQDEIAYSVARNSDGGFVVAGETYSFGAGAPNMYVLRIDSLGDTLWTRTYGGANEDCARSAQQTADSGFIICGKTLSYGAGLGDIYLVKIEADGDTAWTRTYGGARADEGWSVRQTVDDGYVITGSTNSFGAGGADIYLVKTGANGDTVWTRTFGGAGADVGCSVQQTSDSGYIIGGTFGTGGLDACLIKTDRNGDTIWTKTFGGMNDDRGSAVQQTADGGYVLAGILGGTGSNSIWLIKTDPAGNVAVSEPKGNPTRQSSLTVTCEPNPCCTSTVLHLTAGPLDHSTTLLRVYDSQGRLVRSASGTRSSSFRLDLRSLPAGAYFVRCDVAGERATARLVLQR